MYKTACYIGVFFIWIGFAQAQDPRDTRLTLAPVFSDYMVIQRNKPVVFYGQANVDEVIEINFSNRQRTAITDGHGKWKIVFPAMKAGGPYEISFSGNGHKIVLKDILIGDVWLCSGQSNMEFQLKDALTGPEELKSGRFSNSIRLLKFRHSVPWGNVSWDSAALGRVSRFAFFEGTWRTLDTSSAASFSAIAYYFGKRLNVEENVSIGLVEIALGGSPTESWIDRNLLEKGDLYKDMLLNWSGSEQVMNWCRERAAVNLKRAKPNSQAHPFQPGYNYKAGIAPLTDFPIAGVIWYQGESNAHNVPLHEQLFETLVKSWRQAWEDSFPFYYVQLSSIDRAKWPEFRDSQRRLLARTRHSGMAVSYDLGDSLQVHPVRKKEVGERLAALALFDFYKKAIIATGPVIRKATLKNGVIELHFTAAQKLLTENRAPLTGFELVTSDGERLLGSAKILKNRVHISIPQGKKIKTVLYAYQPFTRANLYNEAGFPASTFSISVQ